MEKVKKNTKQLLSLLAVLAVFVMVLVPGTKTNAAKNFTATFNGDYRKWNQGDSAYSEMRLYGCFITAQAKMLYEADVNRGGMNPDTWYQYQRSHSGIVNPPNDSQFDNYNLELTWTGIRAPGNYAASYGKKIEYLGYWNASDNQLWFNIRAGYYTILNFGGHYAIVDNATSLRTGQLYYYESYSPVSDANKYQTNHWNLSPIRLTRGRVGSHVYKVTNANPPKPGNPTNVAVSSQNLGIGDGLTISWANTANATSYRVNLVCTTNSAYSQSATVGGTSASFSLRQPGVYQAHITAVNSAGSSGETVSATCTVHQNVTVTYKDWNGEIIGTQSVKYGGNAAAPTAPQREGYTFQNWNSEGKNLKADIEIQAVYKINTYSVSFADYTGAVIGRVQKVEYGSAATAPTDIPTKTGYVFAGWDTTDYQNVKRSMTVTATYVWGNADLPIVTEIKSAKRNAEATGYDVSVRLSNFPNNFTKGKLLVTLMTKSGKMVASETASISMPSSGEVTENVTVLYSGLVSTVQVSMVGVVDDETTGTPKAKTVMSAIDVGNEWSDWSTTLPTDSDLITESRTEYRYKDKREIRSASTPATPAGFTLVSTANTGTYTDWSGWTEYSTYAPTANNLTQVGTTTGYRYYAFRCSSCGAQDPYSGSCSNCGGSMYWVEEWGTCRGTEYGPGYIGVNSAKGKIYWKDRWWYFEFSNASNGQGGYGQPTRTLYNYRTRQEYKKYTYWQSDFSDWQADAVSASDSRQVETRTVYRFKTNSTEVPCYNYKRYKYENVNTGKIVYTYSSVYADSMDYPGEWEYNKTFTELNTAMTTDDGIVVYNGTGDKSWYRADINKEGTVTEYKTTSTLEDTNGEKRTLDGMAKGCAGKVAMLLVYKGQNADPIASQIEYAAQTTIKEDGSYHFDYVTKEEPTAKTGDFIITIGIEGSTHYQEIGRISAPKAVYSVDFTDEDGNTIGEQKKVVDGGTVEAPEAPEKEGYEFVGWDTGLKNIRENTVITAQYRKKKCTVIFVDWDNTSLNIKEFKYGDVLTLDSLPEKEGQKFDKWTDANGKEVTTVTDNMVVAASYKDTKYVVTFLDWDGKVLSEQEVAYGESATLPENLKAPGDGKVFDSWDKKDEAGFVRKSIVVSPTYKYTETTTEPAFTVTSGTYQTAQTVGLYCVKPNVELYYRIYPLSGEGGLTTTEDRSEFQLYTAPIQITESAVIRAYAKSANANDSEIVSTEIVISGSGNSSGDNTGGNTGGNNSGNNNGNINGGNSNNNNNNNNTNNNNTNVTVPKTRKLSIKSLKNVKGKKVKLTWKAPAKLYGDNFYVEKYTIMYATDKKFKKNKKTVNVKATTTARTIKRLKKGKTYYFKIQYTVKYKGNNGTLKSVQSAWSKAKKVKIKK